MISHRCLARFSDWVSVSCWAKLELKLTLARRVVTRAGSDKSYIDSVGAGRVAKVVDLAAVRNNLEVLRAAAGNRKVMAVVKSDAYGLGAPTVAQDLLLAGVDALAVDTVAEGVALRSAGVQAPILVMDPDVVDNAVACIDNNLIPTVARGSHANVYTSIARRRGQPVEAWLRVNVGLNRFGSRDGFDGLLHIVNACAPWLRIIGVFAHLSDAASDEEKTTAQIKEFTERQEVAQRCLRQSIENSSQAVFRIESSLAATEGLFWPSSLRGTQWIRPGSGLYGPVSSSLEAPPSCRSSGLQGLRLCWSMQARVLDVVTATRSERVGYDWNAAVNPGQEVASIAVGFANGVTSAARNLQVILRGRRCPIIGTPGMNCSHFDVTGVPGVSAGDWATLAGSSEGMTQRVEDVAAMLGYGDYELMTVLRAPVYYIRGLVGTSRDLRL